MDFAGGLIFDRVKVPRRMEWPVRIPKKISLVSATTQRCG